MAVELGNRSVTSVNTDNTLKPGEQVAGYLRVGKNILYVGKGTYLGTSTPPFHNELGKKMYDTQVPVALMQPIGANPHTLESIWGDEVRFMPVDQFNLIVENTPGLQIRLASIAYIRELRQKLML